MITNHIELNQTVTLMMHCSPCVTE